MEPLGIIVFSCIMGTAGFSVILEAVRQLVDHTPTNLPYAHLVIGAPAPAPICSLELSTLKLCVACKLYVLAWS